jgi:hypothetical protein
LPSEVPHESSLFKAGPAGIYQVKFLQGLRSERLPEPG